MLVRPSPSPWQYPIALTRTAHDLGITFRQARRVVRQTAALASFSGTPLEQVAGCLPPIATAAPLSQFTWSGRSKRRRAPVLRLGSQLRGQPRWPMDIHGVRDTPSYAEKH